MPQPVPFPNSRAERVIIYCMTCGRSAWTAASMIEGLFGYLPYGLLTRRLHCRKGCGDRFGVVLPADTPTPRQFVERYADAPPRGRTVEPRLRSPLDEDLPEKLVEVGKGGTFIRLHAAAHDGAILHWGFDYLLKKYTHDDGKGPHLVVARGAQWSRDSRRDYKIVAGKFVERDGGK